MLKLTTEQRRSLSSKAYWWSGPEYFFLVANSPDLFFQSEIEQPWRDARSAFSALKLELKNSNDVKLKKQAEEVGEENLFLYADLSKTPYAKAASILRKAFAKTLELIEWDSNFAALQKEYATFAAAKQVA